MPALYLPVAAIILGISVLQIANGILITILPISLTEAGYSIQAYSAVATAHSLSFLAGCVLSVRIIGAVGHIRAFAAYAAASSVTALSFAVAPDPTLWMALRLVTGFCSAGLFTVAESWLNEMTPNAHRGRVFSVYTIVQKVALVGGQFVLLLTGGPVVLGLFMIASAFYSMSLIPVALNRAGTPSIAAIRTLPLRKLYRIAPAALIGCVASGLINNAVASIGPIWGLAVGLSAGLAGAIPAMAQVGNLLAQWPLGRLSDRIDRRGVMLGASIVTMLVSLTLALVRPESEWLLAVLFGLWGAASISTYGICVAHANDLAPRGTAVALSSSLLLSWGVGACAGPLVASAVIDRIGPNGLFLYGAAVAAVTAVFTAWRMTRRQAPPAEEREPFVNRPATSPIVSELTAPRDSKTPG
ncbi:MFS transporter [Inquilinus limosus]|uniref:MFS transporter n=1 Tax=Inquilinus limosus TaxID=171674 RepID=UPI00040475F5|nr:MFS transporter [Inquilinus limosus]